MIDAVIVLIAVIIVRFLVEVVHEALNASDPRL